MTNTHIDTYLQINICIYSMACLVPAAAAGAAKRAIRRQKGKRSPRRQRRKSWRKEKCLLFWASLDLPCGNILLFLALFHSFGSFLPGVSIFCFCFCLSTLLAPSFGVPPSLLPLPLASRQKKAQTRRINKRNKLRLISQRHIHSTRGTRKCRAKECTVVLYGRSVQGTK